MTASGSGLRLRRWLPWLLSAVATAPVWGQTAPPAASITQHYRAPADQLIAAALKDSSAYARLAELVDRFGSRLSGTPQLERTLDWALDQMHRDGLENVRGEPVMVPHWVRGRESAELLEPRAKSLAMLGLGGSIATPKKGITAPVLVVSSFSDLTARAAEAKGKIVLFDAPFTAYRETVRYRYSGASEAARVGAVAALVRSVTPQSINSPHTGMMGYDSTVARIPTAAITVEDAEMLHRMQDRGERIVVRLTMEARMLPDSPSRNAVAEVVGSERPDEVVVLGGHIDSWDVGQGAMDDGGGAVAAWAAVKLIQDLGLHPRRTVRVVLWTNEENGQRGATGYRDAHADAVSRHALAMESDGGVFKPVGFRFTGSDSALTVLGQVSALLDGIGAGKLHKGEADTDIGPLVELGVPGLSLDVEDSRYFWFHHTNGDTMDKLDPGEMAQCVATLAVMAYVVADLPDPLPR